MDVLMYTSLSISALALVLLFINMVLYLTGRPYVGEERGDDKILLALWLLLVPVVNAILIGAGIGAGAVCGLIGSIGWVGENIRRRSLARRAKKRDEREEKNAGNAADWERRRQILSQQNYEAVKDAAEANNVIVTGKKPSWDEIAALGHRGKEEECLKKP